MKNEKLNFVLLSIVAIVAIVGLVVLFNGAREDVSGMMPYYDDGNVEFGMKIYDHFLVEQEQKDLRSCYAGDNYDACCKHHMDMNAGYESWCDDLEAFFDATSP